MTKNEFVKRWAKRATSGGAIEAFENDVAKLLKSVIVMTSSAIQNGLLAGLKDVPKRDQERFRKLIQEVQPAVGRALDKLYQ